MNEKRSILVVDDEDFLTKLIKLRLNEKNFDVERSGNGEEAIAFLRRNNKPDLILLDLIMPKMSGFEFLEVAAADPVIAPIPIMILSNLSQESDLQKISRFGVKAYLTKAHVSLDRVITTIEGLVGQSASNAVIATNAN